MFRLLCSLCLALVVVGCASKSRAPAEASAARPARIKDSPPESRAALRAADPQVTAEGDENRWGIEAARERKRRTDEQNQAAAAPAAPRPAPTGPFDVRAAPSSPPPAPKRP